MLEIKSKKYIRCYGWMPFINGRPVPELYETHKDAIDHAEWMLDLYGSGEEKNNVSAEFYDEIMDAKELLKYVDEEDLRT